MCSLVSIVARLVCLHFKDVCVCVCNSHSDGPGFSGVQTRSTTCAMTTAQTPAAPVCICYIPCKSEQKRGHAVCFGNLEHAHIRADTRGGFKCKFGAFLLWLNSLYCCHIQLHLDLFTKSEGHFLTSYLCFVSVIISSLSPFLPPSLFPSINLFSSLFISTSYFTFLPLCFKLKRGNRFLAVRLWNLFSYDNSRPFPCRAGKTVRPKPEFFRGGKRRKRKTVFANLEIKMMGSFIGSPPYQGHLSENL